MRLPYITPIARRKFLAVLDVAGWVAFIVTMVLILPALSGCAGAYLPADPAKMSPEQLKAIASDRNVSAACTTAGGPWGTGRTIYVQLDRAAISSGVVSVDQDCKVSVQSDPKGDGK